MKSHQQLNDMFLRHKETALYHRYIINEHIKPLMDKLGPHCHIEVIGRSVNNLPIYAVKIGHGEKKILMWSQMHGNESTTTKALFDLFGSFSDNSMKYLMDKCQLCVIPILNPDGAKAYTRHNTNGIDLNRDAQDRSQPESVVLHTIFKKFKPHFCFNLHGQRTIFSAGPSENPATISFLAPAQDEECSVTKTRKKAMDIIVSMHDALKEVIPDQIGIYNDSFNINCVGDTFQSLDIPTILFEAGHFANDYGREEARKFMFIALVTALCQIADNKELGSSFNHYFGIPENKKSYYDVMMLDAKRSENGDSVDLAIQYQEVLIEGVVHFVPKIEKIGKNLKFYGHRVINCGQKLVLGPKKEQLFEGDEIDFVHLNNEKYSLKLDKS